MNQIKKAALLQNAIEAEMVKAGVQGRTIRELDFIKEINALAEDKEFRIRDNLKALVKRGRVVEKSKEGRQIRYMIKGIVGQPIPQPGKKPELTILRKDGLVGVDVGDLIVWIEVKKGATK
jgi:hypothetical protein